MAKLNIEDDIGDSHHSGSETETESNVGTFPGLSKELIGTVFEYLSPEDIQQLEGFPEAKDYAIEHCQSLTMNTKDFFGYGDYLGRYRRLKSLSFRNPKRVPIPLTNIIGTISSLDELEELDLQAIPLSHNEDGKTLARELNSLISLTTLRLQTTHPFDPTIAFLAPSINKLVHLTTLDLMFQSSKLEVLKLLIPTFERIQNLALQYANDPESRSLKGLFPLLNHVTQLTSLTLTEYKFDIDEKSALAEFLSHLPNLVSLNLEGIPFVDDDVGEVVRALESLTHLETLKITSESLGAVIAFADVVGHYPELKSLDLDYCESTLIDSNIFASHLGNALAQTPKLKELNITRITLTHRAFQELLPSLQRLSLTNLQICLTGPRREELKRLFSRLTQLKTLSLWFDRIAPEFHLEDSLTSLTHLEKLTLRRLCLMGRDLAELSTVLTNNPDLQQLHFDTIQLPDGVDNLLPGLGTLKQLTQFSLTETGIDDAFFRKIGPIISKMANLEILYLGILSFRNNDYDDKIKTLLSSLPVLEFSCLGVSCIDFDGRRRLETYFERIFPDLQIVIFGS